MTSMNQCIKSLAAAPQCRNHRRPNHHHNSNNHHHQRRRRWWRPTTPTSTTTSTALLALGCCLVFAGLELQDDAALAQQLMPAQPLPSLISQLTGRSPAASSSQSLVEEFLAQEQRRTREAAAAARRPAATGVAPKSSTGPNNGPGADGARLAPDTPGSIYGPTPTYSQSLGGTNFRLDQYHTIDEIYAFMDKLARRFPKRVHVFNVGVTTEGRSIRALELLNNATDPDYVWLDALTHAREWITGSTLLYTIDRLASGGGGASSQPQHVAFSKNYIVVPVVNPDGYAYTWSTNRMWRKNRSKSGARAPDSKCVGADLNRNFDHSFGGEGSSNDPCSHIYSGPFPLSEPETRSMADLMWSLRDRIKFYLTMHSFNQLWACPYAHTTEQSAHLQEHMRVLRNIQQAVYQSGGVRYEIGPLSTSLYVGSGFGIDFAYDKCGIVNSYLVELRDSGTNGFILPADQIMPTAQETFAGLKAGLRTVFGP